MYNLLDVLEHQFTCLTDEEYLKDYLLYEDETIKDAESAVIISETKNVVEGTKLLCKILKQNNMNLYSPFLHNEVYGQDHTTIFDLLHDFRWSDENQIKNHLKFYNFIEESFNSNKIVLGKYLLKEVKDIVCNSKENDNSQSM